MTFGRDELFHTGDLSKQSVRYRGSEDRRIGKGLFGKNAF